MKNTQRSSGLKFPKSFLWGASTSAHQVEGGQHNQWTVWELENARSLAARAPYQFDDLDNWTDIKRQATAPSNYVSGRAVDHYSRYEEDFEIIKELNLNTFRFSIEWSRVEPEQGRFDSGAIDHYRKYLKALRSRGITPVATLFHFTLPVWFVEMGGFEKRRNVKYFLKFVEVVLEELGSQLSWITTINEPTVYAGESYLNGQWPPNRNRKLLGFRVLCNQIYAHKKIYKMTRKNSQWKVSMAHNLTNYYPGDDAWLSGLSASVAGYFANTFTLRRVRRHSDFLAVNYYFSRRIYGYRNHDPNDRLSDMGWDMDPRGLESVLVDLSERYSLPIMITENGLADASDENRKWWLSETIKAMNSAIKQGVGLVGYLHWSLLDNFEWDKGFWPKFGLVSVNRRTMERTIKPSAKWFARVVQKLSK